MLDKPSLVKLVCGKTGVSEYKIIDTKIRDTYSFIQVTNDEADKIGKLKGLTVGTRRINVELASEDAEEKEKKPRRSKERAEAVGKRQKPERKEGKDARRKSGKDNNKNVGGVKKGKVYNAKGQLQNPKPRAKRTKKL